MIKSTTLTEQGLICIELENVIEIPSTLQTHSGQTEQITCLYIKSPCVQDLPSIDKINHTIIGIRKEFAQYMMDLASKMANTLNDVKQEVQTIQTFEIVIKNFLNGIASNKPDLYEKLLKAVWELAKKKIYTADGLSNPESYDNVDFDFLTKKDDLMLFVNELEIEIASKYLFFFGKYFKSLLTIQQL